MRKRLALLLLLVALTAVTLSALCHVPYIFTVIGFSAWAFVGHLVTADDDAPGGWSNPDGTLPFLWGELALKGAILAALCGVAIWVPVVRTFGAAQ